MNRPHRYRLTAGGCAALASQSGRRRERGPVDWRVAYGLTALAEAVLAAAQQQPDSAH